MRGLPKPRELGLYRIAAIALFRALLRQSQAAAGLNQIDRNALQNVIRNRFRDNASLVSVQHTKMAYTAGYHGLDILDECVDGSEDAMHKITDLLARAPARLKAPPPRPKSKEQRQRERHEATGHDPSSLACPPPDKQFLNVFPRKTVAGERKVPYFSVASQFPFVRYKKPQPANVSRVLRDKIDQKSERAVKLSVIQNFYVPLAQYEDTWDRHLETFCGQGPDVTPQRVDDEAEERPLETPWVEEFARQARDMDAMNKDSYRKKLQLARRMFSAVELEEQLAEQEARARHVRDDQTEQAAGSAFWSPTPSR